MRRSAMILTATWLAVTLAVDGGCERDTDATATADEPARTEQQTDQKQGALARSGKAGEQETPTNADNRAPTIEDLSFEPSKIVQCGQTVKICVEAADPDGDEMRTEWKIRNDMEPTDGIETVSTTQKDGTLTECVQFVPKSGESQMTVKVIDKRPVLTRPGSKTEKIHLYDSMNFPVRAGGDNC